MDRQECLAGLQDAAPAVPPLVTGGMIFGVTAVKMGFSPLAATLLSLFAFAGTAQLAALELIGDGAALPVVLGTVLLINLRYVVFSASIAPKIAHLSRAWRAVVAYPLSDINYALAEVRFNDDVNEGHRGWYLVGASTPLVAGLAGGTLTGTLLGRVVGAGLHLDFAVTLVFVSLLAAQIEERATAVGSAGGVVVATALADLPANLGLLVAVVAGTVVGVLAAGRLRGAEP